MRILEIYELQYTALKIQITFSFPQISPERRLLQTVAARFDKSASCSGVKRWFRHSGGGGVVFFLFVFVLFLKHESLHVLFKTIIYSHHFINKGF